jgi:hypothetical protein
MTQPMDYATRIRIQKETGSASAQVLLLTAMQEAVARGEYPSLAEAYAPIMAAHPVVAKQARQEAMAPPVRKQHYGPPIAGPEPTEAHLDFDDLVERERKKSPHLSKAELMRRVSDSPEGQRVMRQHRAEHYARVPRD